MTVAAIAAVLGGRQTLKRKVASEPDLIRLIREGLPVDTLTLLARELAIDRKTLAKLVGISDRTLNRRIAAASRLSPEESDRITRLAGVVAKTKDLLGTSAKASLWLQTPNHALNDERPLDLLDTDAGARSVETILGRIAYGIYS